MAASLGIAKRQEKKIIWQSFLLGLQKKREQEQFSFSSTVFKITRHRPLLEAGEGPNHPRTEEGESGGVCQEVGGSG